MRDDFGAPGVVVAKTRVMGDGMRGRMMAGICEGRRGVRRHERKGVIILGKRYSMR